MQDIQVKQAEPKDFSDPFNAGQMVGMLMMLTFLEKNPTIPRGAVEQLKWACANNVQDFFKKPSEDIFLMVNGLVSEIEHI
jgi:hypothetical protein